MEIYIGNLPSGTGAAELRRLFAGYGQLRDVAVVARMLPRGRVAHCAYARMEPEAAARRALRALNLTQFRGQSLMVMEHLRKGRGAADDVGPWKAPRLREPVIEAVRLFRRRSAEEARCGERRRRERRLGERRVADRRVLERRENQPPSFDHPLGEERFNEHRVYQRRVSERRGAADRRADERRHQDRRER